MPAKHFRYGGSTAGRTLQCPAWRVLADELPKQPDGASPDADRGTLLHDCMEDLLNDPNLNTSDLLGRKLNEQVVTDDDIIEAIIPAFDTYSDFADDENIEIEMPEVEVKYAEDIGGTSDIICASDDTVYVVDWKFGFHPVDAEENPQGLFYAMCARADPNIGDLFEGRDRICIVIVQPQNDKILQAFYTDTKRLNEFEDAYFDALENQNPLIQKTGAYCKFCPAQPFCPAKTGEARAALMLDPNSKHADVLTQALDMADQVEAWAKAVKKFAHEQAELGLKIDGYKLVDKRAIRKWKDESAILDMVRKARKLKLEDGTDLKLKSPAQLEKVCVKKGIDFDKYAAYIESVSSGTTLAKADDKRPEAINIQALNAAINATD